MEQRVKMMFEEMNYLALDKSIFGLNHWGGKDASAWLQKDFEETLATKFAESKVRLFDRRLTEALIDSLIEYGFFKKPRTVEDVSLACEIIKQYLNLQSFKKVHSKILSKKET